MPTITSTTKMATPITAPAMPPEERRVIFEWSGEVEEGLVAWLFEMNGVVLLLERWRGGVAVCLLSPDLFPWMGFGFVLFINNRLSRAVLRTRNEANSRT